MKDIPLAFIDLETTGIDPAVHEIIEIGLVLARQSKEPRRPLVEVERLCLKIRPEHIERADPKALQVNHYNEEEWKDAILFADASVILDEKLHGHAIVAQNVAFDMGFLMRAYEKEGKSLDKIIHYYKYDLGSMVIGKEYWNREYQRFTLNELARNIGVENTKAHSALADAVATFEIANLLFQRL